MRKYGMNEITFMQYIFLIQGAQVGTGILSLPRTLAEKNGTDGWMNIVLAWAINCLAGWIILLTLRKYPDYTLPDLFDYLFGKWIGRLLLLPLIAYFAFCGLVIMVNTMLFIRAWFLPKTPAYLIVLLFAIPGFFIVRHGIRVQARYVELVSYMMLWVPFIFLMTLKHGHWIHLLPIFKESWEHLIRGLSNTVFSFTGIEILFFIHPFLKKKEYAVHGMVIANTLTMLLYLYVTIVSFVFYAPDEITSLNQPVLSMLKTIDFRFLERVDMIFLAIYLFVVSRAWSAYTYCSVFSTSHMLNKQNYSLYTLLFFMMVIGCVYVIQPTWNQAEKWSLLLSKAAMVVLYVLPVLLLVYSSVFEKYRRWKTE